MSIACSRTPTIDLHIVSRWRSYVGVLEQAIHIASSEYDDHSRIGIMFFPCTFFTSKNSYSLPPFPRPRQQGTPTASLPFHQADSELLFQRRQIKHRSCETLRPNHRLRIPVDGGLQYLVHLGKKIFKISHPAVVPVRALALVHLCSCNLYNCSDAFRSMIRWGKE